MDYSSHPWITAGPRLLEPSMPPVQVHAANGNMSENKRGEPIKAGDIATDGAPKPSNVVNPTLNPSK